MVKFYSHAIESDGNRKGSKFLKNHLCEVGNAIEKLMNQAPISNLRFIPGMGYLLGIAHDFGKYTTFFQEYLLQNKKDSDYYHGFLSAIFASYLIDTFLKNNNYNEHRYLPLFFYFVVLHHHGDLNALELDIIPGKDLEERNFLSIEEPLRSKLKALESQVSNICENVDDIEKEYAELLQNNSTKGIVRNFLNSWKCTLSNIHRLSYQLFNNENEKTKFGIFISTLFLYSLLIDTDKKEAANIIDIERKEIPCNLVDRYREDPQNKIDTSALTGINGIRNKVYSEVIKKISEVPLSHHIFTLTAPTGTGKTLASLSCALRLRKRLKEEKGYTPRIIYSLPFTSIIDQNYEEFKKVLSCLPDFSKNENIYLVKHHHLADLKYKVENEEKPISESLLLVESWESEIIVTTFIQFLHSIIGFKNSFLKRFHNIAGSIILLDETQNIPIEYWPLVNNIFRLLVEYLECYIILLTATKPLIFDEEETVELLNDNKDYFNKMDRITLTPDLLPISLEEFFKKFKSIYNKSKSFLMVFNTIKSSIMFYNMLKEDNEFKGLVEKNLLFYLSANIIPKERAKRIEIIKKLLDKKEKIIVISTQCVEAGIDIDSDVVIRDIGPVDSLIQVAGRCNREMNEKGNVYIFNLVDENKCSYAKYVYGSTHYIVSFDLLKEKKSLQESMFLDLINQYFTDITQKKNQDDSKYIWDAIKDFRFYQRNMKSIADFELIKEKNYIDVFVEMDEAKDFLVKYIEKVINEKDFRKRQDNYFLMRKDFKSYVISIPAKFSNGLVSINEYILKVPNEQLGNYYDNDTGFKRTDEGTFIF